MVESGSSWVFSQGVLRGDESDMKTVPILKHLLFSTLRITEVSRNTQKTASMVMMFTVFWVLLLYNGYADGRQIQRKFANHLDRVRTTHAIAQGNIMVNKAKIEGFGPHISNLLCILTHTTLS